MQSDEYLEALASEIKNLPPRNESSNDLNIAVKRVPDEGTCVICVTVPIADDHCSDLLIRALNQDETGFHYSVDDGKLSVFAQMFSPDADIHMDQFSDVTAMLIASAKVAQMMIAEVDANG